MKNLKSPRVNTKTKFPSNETLQNRDNRGHKTDAPQDCWESKKGCIDQDCLQYFWNVAEVIQNGLKEDGVEKANFIENVLEQTVGKEVELCCDRSASRSMEKLLEDCNNPYIIIRFMEAFSRSLSIVCVDQCASHIAERLLHASLLLVKNLPLAAEPVEAKEKNNINTALLFWAYKFGQFCCQELELCLNDTYGCHVLSAVIQLLGCCHVNEDVFQNRKLPKRRHTHEKYTGGENSYRVAEIFPSVPVIFLDLLKHITGRIVEYSHLSDIIYDSRCSPVIQILLLVLKKRNLKCFEKISQTLLSIIFSRRNNEGVPLALCDRSCSYLMEKIVGLSDEHTQELIWMGISQCLPQLILHPIGNHIIQSFFCSVHSKNQFEAMFDVTIDYFEKILVIRHYGIWLSVANSCNRFKSRQVQFLTKMMQVLQCSEPMERNSYFAQLLLGLETYDEYKKKVPTLSQSSTLSINLLGSLILQEIFKFSKPFKAVRSILDMKPEMLMSLACQTEGCHALTSVLESANIARKDKEKLVQKLKPVVVSIACDFTGNFTLCRMWPMLSLDQKTIIARELIEKKSSLKQHKCGATIYKKFALLHFELHLDKWKEIQQSSEKKQQMLKEIIA